MTQTQNLIGNNLLLPGNYYFDLMNIDSFPDNLCVLSHDFFNEEAYDGTDKYKTRYDDALISLR